jgi:hypothetical protein
MLARGYGQNSFSYKASYWPVTFYPDDKSPYGCFMLKAMLTDMMGQDKVDAPFLSGETFNKTHQDTGALYIMFGYDIFIQDTDWDGIVDFASRGNTVLIAVQNLPYEINKVHFDYMLDDYYWSDEIQLTFLNGQVDGSFTYQQNFSSSFINWTGVAENNRFEAPGMNVLGKGEVDDDVLYNLVEFTVGNGKLIFCTTPLIFTNFAMKNGTYYYTEAFFGSLSFNKVYFDEYARVPYPEYYEENVWDDEDDPVQSSSFPDSYKSPLDFLMKNPALAMAYLFIILMIIAYVLLNSKRRQRAIPVAVKPLNLSVQFAETVARMYFHEGKPVDLLRQQERIFYHISRKKYRVDTRDLSGLSEEMLVLRSGKSKVAIANIFEILRRLKANGSITQKDVNQMHEYLEQL